MFMYFIIGALVASFLQNIDKEKKRILMVVTIAIEAIICASLYALSNTYPEFFFIKTDSFDELMEFNKYCSK